MPPAAGDSAPAAAEAVLVRGRVAQSKGERLLRRLGVRVLKLRHAVSRPALPEMDEEPATIRTAPPRHEELESSAR